MHILSSKLTSIVRIAKVGYLTLERNQLWRIRTLKILIRCYQRQSRGQSDIENQQRRCQKTEVILNKEGQSSLMSHHLIGLLVFLSRQLQKCLWELRVDK